MVGRKPGTVGWQGTLASKELLVVVQPIQWIDGAVISRELQFVKYGRVSPLSSSRWGTLGRAVEWWCSGWRRREHAAPMEQGTVNSPPLPVENARGKGATMAGRGARKWRGRHMWSGRRCRVAL